MRMIHASGIRGGAPGKLIKILLIDSFDPLLARLPYIFIYFLFNIGGYREESNLFVYLYY